LQNRAVAIRTIAVSSSVSDHVRGYSTEHRMTPVEPIKLFIDEEREGVLFDAYLKLEQSAAGPFPGEVFSMNRRIEKISAAVFVSMALVLGAGGWSSARASTTCDQTTIQGIAPADTTITSAGPASVTIGVYTIPYCDVLGYVTTTDPGPNEVNFELALPDSWNGKFLFGGNGGFAGSIQAFAGNPSAGQLAVALGYAAAATDTGHSSPLLLLPPPLPGLAALDGSWALDNLAKQEDFGFRGVHVTAQAAETITGAFYGESPAHSYFDGCSDGGREAMVEAEVYPDDFDGIIAGDPAIGNLIVGFNWNDEALLATPDTWIPPAKLPLIDNAVLENCDARDGVVDGLIQDPRRCTFNPASLKCPASDSNADTDPTCLSEGQIDALRLIYAGPRTEDGTQVYPGFTESDPGGLDGWGAWITGFYTPTFGVAEPWGAIPLPSFYLAPAQWSFQDQYMQFFVFGAGYDSLQFNINSNALEEAEATITLGGSDGVNPDLSAFVNAGHKLLMYHGWSDPALTPLETVGYYDSVVKAMGGSFKTTQQSVRLFMVPGMHHCGGGPGPNVFDALTALDNWVSNGQAPSEITAYHFDSNGNVTRSMPLCPYPEVAVFTGTKQLVESNPSAVDVASNWVCKLQREPNHRLISGN
jgi:Tannase and feruloyl esterase